MTNLAKSTRSSPHGMRAMQSRSTPRLASTAPAPAAVSDAELELELDDILASIRRILNDEDEPPRGDNRAA